MRPVVGAANADAVDNLVDAGARLEDALEPWRGRRLPSGLYDELTAALASASERVARALAAVRKSEDDPARKARCLQAGGHLGADLVVVADLPDTHGAWVEGPPASPVLKVALVDVAELLATVLWDDVTAVLTSATVPPRLASRVGLAGADCKTLDVGSPFAFREQALLYCPPLPDPRAPGYEAALHTELLELMRAAGGRTLALFTSRRAMQAAAEALAPLVPWEVMTQDQLPKPALVAAFSADPSSCLFATMGFWQGVDVPGEALSVVAIDRIPFPRPDEPLMQARRERAGPAAFRLVDLPRAATLLAQGAGRLIRSRQDRGVVAVLDSRLAVAGYKPELLAGLPPMRRTRDRPAVQAFLAPLRAGQP
jgi:ATP-dependent DNA helicase DinG